MNLTLWHYLAIATLGILASIINILAGGGSNLILPLLMAFGVPPDIANASNRVGIFFQSLTGIRGFRNAGALPTHDLHGILLPMVAGGLVGSVLASVLPNQILKPALLVCILGVATLTFLKPQLLLPPQNVQERKVSDTRGAAVLLFAVGIYGGFVQASTAFILLPVLAGVLHYNLLRANALKLVCTLAFTIVALAVFIVQGQIWWDVGLVLAAGNILGSMIGVKIALKLSPNTLRTILFVMTVVAVAAAFLK
ncbi:MULTISPECIES: sulfite exporter TauE/SafE family protein [unclassified Neisseria]|uniref:sulfite exporter TauE/SafE family protein n=1 Tax=unclassified Neisseria TaxID=2623750 RepID=UPI0026668D38|nr:MULTISPECIES: sulfite exporter TauE/SafE family protein [unclassified Neisseria]MDO1510624.1 sulfite exporter TauE/SafE family protein [Neisseria sp. MVDL19-042950]MDO1516252.1 sulfite exporter TauE/SafE family protein [Neisseria sp. MVDL18-041461]MDO1564276.1 sulfite exporter TauE/SafE family protein [Neisseria sp. MVDL20-010259]